MQEMHELRVEDREYRLGVLGSGTLLVAVLGFAYGIWTGRYFLSLAIAAAQALLVLWIRRGTTLLQLLHWGLFAGILLWIVHYVFFQEPALFYLLDNAIQSRSGGPVPAP